MRVSTVQNSDHWDLCYALLCRNDNFPNQIMLGNLKIRCKNGRSISAQTIFIRFNDFKIKIFMNNFKISRTMIILRPKNWIPLAASTSKVCRICKSIWQLNWKGLVQANSWSFLWTRLLETNCVACSQYWVFCIVQKTEHW